MTTKNCEVQTLSCKNIDKLTYDVIQASKVQGLWRAVIMQALVDASSNSSNKRAMTHKKRATKWLCKKETDEFIETCMLAGMEPSYVQMKADRVIRATLSQK